MIPKKARDMMRGYAESKGVPYTHSEIMLDAYWKEIKNMLRNLDSPRVRIRGLGNFELKEWEVNREMKRHQRLVLSIPIMRRGPFIDNLEKLENIYEVLQEEKILKAMNKDQRERDESEGEIQQGLEE